MSFAREILGGRGLVKRRYLAIPISVVTGDFLGGIGLSHVVPSSDILGFLPWW